MTLIICLKYLCYSTLKWIFSWLENNSAWWCFIFIILIKPVIAMLLLISYYFALLLSVHHLWVSWDHAAFLFSLTDQSLHTTATGSGSQNMPLHAAMYSRYQVKTPSEQFPSVHSQQRSTNCVQQQLDGASTAEGTAEIMGDTSTFIAQKRQNLILLVVFVTKAIFQVCFSVSY